MWQAVKNYFAEFKILKMCPREFWLLNLVINFFEMLAYFSFITVLTLYLTENIGFDDQWTGNLVGLFTLAISIVIFFVGFIIDVIGIKKALVFSMAILIPTRFGIGTTSYMENWYMNNSMDVKAAKAKIVELHYDEHAFSKNDKRLREAENALLEKIHAETGEKKEFTDEGEIMTAVRTFAKGKRFSVDIDRELQKGKSIYLERLLHKVVEKSIDPEEDNLAEMELEDQFEWLFEKEKKPISGDYRTDMQSVVSIARNRNVVLDVVEDSKASPGLYREIVLVGLVNRYPDLKEKFAPSIERLQGEELKQRVIEIVKAYTELRTEFGIQDLMKLYVIILLAIMALGEAMMVPAIYVAIRRYTNKRTSGTGFNFQYLTMNIAAVMAGYVIAFLRTSYGNESIFLWGGVFAIICTVASVMLRTNIDLDDEGNIIDLSERKTQKEKDEAAAEGFFTMLARMFQEVRDLFMSVVTQVHFWRFMLFLILLLGVRLVFTHQFLVMPKYYTRVMGPDAPIGLLNSINPTIIVIGLILAIPILNKFSVFKLIMVGTTVSALSMFALVVPVQSAIAIFGDLPAHFISGWNSVMAAFGGFMDWASITVRNNPLSHVYLILILLQIVIFAFGEVIWSPRLSEYTVTIAPKGQEASYMGLAALPMFLAKPINGWLSGKLLTNYCPENVLDDLISGARNFWNGPEFMWLIYALLAISSPILVYALKNVIKPKERDDEDEETTGNEEQPQES